MEKVNFSFTVSKEAQLEKEELVQQLLASTFVQEWMQHQSVPKDMVEKHTYKIKDYVDAKSKCNRCAGLQACLQPTCGYVLTLEYDGSMNKIARPCHYQKEISAALSHKKQFLLCDMSDEQLQLSFNSISLENEKTTYIALVDELIETTQNNSNGFYLCGEPGTGKTYLACCFINELAKQGKRCAFINVSNYMAKIKASMYDKDAYTKYINVVKSADVVVFDDIGGESASNWTRDEILLPILNERMENKRICVFTSNYDMGNLVKYYALNSKLVNDQVGATRIVERMKALSLQKVVNGANRRLKK